jgi:hypothetical protein
MTIIGEVYHSAEPSRNYFVDQAIRDGVNHGTHLRSRTLHSLRMACIRAEHGNMVASVQTIPLDHMC